MTSPLQPLRDDLHDVVIYCYETGIIDTLAGENMRRDKGFYNAEKRLKTVLSRGNLSDRYGVKIVPAGKYRKGDKL